MSLTDALKAACTTQGLPAEVGDRPKNAGAKPFVVIWEYAPVRTPKTMALARTETTTLTCHCVGLTDDAARIAETKLAAAVFSLYGAVVDGRLVGEPEQLMSQPLVRDDDVSPSLYDLAVEWRLRTYPT